MEKPSARTLLSGIGSKAFKALIKDFDPINSYISNGEELTKNFVTYRLSNVHCSNIE